MKKLIVTLAAIATTSSAFAGNLNLDVRFDSDSATFNTDAAKPGYQKYYVQTGRVDWNGAVNQDLSYRLRLRFDKDQGAVNKRDNLNDTTDFAYLTHKMGDFTLIGGKFDAGMNGFEGATSGADLYFKSQAYSSSYNSSALRFGTGVGAAYAFGDHSITLANMNALTDELVGTDLAQTNSVSALIYKGAFMDKSLNIIGSYHQTHKSGDKDGTYNFAVLGAKYSQAEWFASLDINMENFKNATTADQTDTVNSYVAHGGYNINDQYAVKAKLESSLYTKKTSASADTKYTTMGTGLALEYKPIKDANFRYHLAYTSVETEVKPSSGSSTKPNESHVILGARLNADFLK